MEDQKQRARRAPRLGDRSRDHHRLCIVAVPMLLPRRWSLLLPL
jgi:hypothetical protein